MIALACSIDDSLILKLYCLVSDVVMVYLQSILYIASIYIFYFLGKKKLCTLETIVRLLRVQSFFEFGT